MDIEILTLLGQRDMYEKHFPLIQRNKHFLASTTQKILRVLKEYYSVIREDNIAWDHFAGWALLTKYPNIKEDERELFNALIDKVVAYEPEEAVLENIVQALLERKLAEDLIGVCEDISAGTSSKGIEDIEHLVKEWREACSSLDEDEHIVTNDLNELLSNVMGGGLDWKQSWMNQSCGPVRKGDFIALVKRPDTGGTSFMAGQANAWAKQSQKPVLWVNNEQEGGKVKVRIVQEAVEMTNTEMAMDKKAAYEKYRQVVGEMDKIIVIDNAVVTTSDIERACEKHQPCAIIIDQLWKVKGLGDINEIKTQTSLANWARELCKQYAPVVGVYQADGEAEGKEYFGMERIYMSKTAVQGECDLIICMGRSHEQNKQNSRFFHFPKHKLAGGGAYFQASMKSARWEREFIGELGVFK